MCVAGWGGEREVQSSRAVAYQAEACSALELWNPHSFPRCYGVSAGVACASVGAHPSLEVSPV